MVVIGLGKVTVWRRQDAIHLILKEKVIWGFGGLSYNVADRCVTVPEVTKIFIGVPDLDSEGTNPLPKMTTYLKNLTIKTITYYYIIHQS